MLISSENIFYLQKIPTTNQPRINRQDISKIKYLQNKCDCVVHSQILKILSYYLCIFFFEIVHRKIFYRRNIFFKEKFCTGKCSRGNILSGIFCVEIFTQTTFLLKTIVVNLFNQKCIDLATKSTTVYFWLL